MRLTAQGDVARGSRSRPGANHAVHADPRWAALSRRLIARHVGEHGWVCPGDGTEHPAHSSHDLTLDHALAMVDGGASFPSDDQLRVLCRSWNSTLGARAVNAKRAGRLAHPAPATERAAIRSRYGW